MYEASTFKLGKDGGDAAVAKQLCSEYHLLRSLTDKLKTMANAKTLADATDLNKTLEHVRAHLYRQFALEEKDGFLQIVMDRRPSLEHEINHLREEHQQLLGWADSLYKQSGAMKNDPGAWSDFSMRVKHFLSELSHHEQTENMLVMNIFGIDVGAGD